MHSSNQLSSIFAISIQQFKKQPPELVCEKAVLKNFVKFTGKHLCQSLFFNKVVGVRASTLLKKGLWHGCFPADFAKFLGTLFLQNFCGRELLEYKQIESKNLLNHWKLFVMREMVSLKKRRSRSRSRGHE